MKRRIKKGDSMEASYKHSYKTGENLLNSLSVYNVGYQKCDPEYQWGPGVRDHYCIHHILSGSGCYCTGTVSKHLEEGDTFILYPGVELRYQADADKIQGDTLVLGIGKSGEPYEGIGRGELNIEGMPVYRDAMGGIGTPTSDNERTKLEAGTTHLLTIINGYSGKEGLQEAADYMLELLKEFAASKDEELIYF